MIPHSAIFDQSTLAHMIEHDPIIGRYRAFFALVDWEPVLQQQAHHLVGASVATSRDFALDVCSRPSTIDYGRSTVLPPDAPLPPPAPIGVISWCR